MKIDVKKTLYKLRLLIAPWIKVIFVSEKRQKFMLVWLNFWILNNHLIQRLHASFFLMHSILKEQQNTIREDLAISILK